MPKTIPPGSIVEREPQQISERGNDIDNVTPVFDDVSTDVAREAYELYRERGYVDGYDFDDWIEAERRVKQRYEAAASNGPGRPVS